MKRFYLEKNRKGGYQILFFERLKKLKKERVWCGVGKKMNIFALHWRQRKCARWHVDKHIVKMLLEYCQLLYTAHWALYYPGLLECQSSVALSRAQKKLGVPEYMKTAPLCDSTGEPTYRPCHIHHPCAVWSRTNSGNYKWLAKLGIEVAREYTHRFKKVHSCQKHMEWLVANLPPTIKRFPRREFPIAMADEYKISKNPIICYRYYYNTSKAERGLIQYTNRHQPHWLQPEGT